MPNERSYNRRALIICAVEGNRLAIAELLENNMGWITNTALGYNRPEETDDLIEEGIYGFLESIPKYDFNSGCEFMTYAGYWVRKRMNGYIRKIEAVHITDTDRRNLKEEYGKVPTSLTIAASSASETVRKYLDSIADTSRSVEEKAEIEEAREIIRRAIEALPPKQADTIRRFYGIGRSRQTQQQIADELGLSRFSIAQRLRKAREALRENPNLIALIAD